MVRVTESAVSEAAELTAGTLSLLEGRFPGGRDITFQGVQEGQIPGKRGYAALNQERLEFA